MKRASVDIVVPVGDDAERLARCVQSVERNGGDWRLLLVDDGASPPPVRELLGALSARKSPRIAVLRNDHAPGFAGCANRGLAASRREAVLLEPGCVVTSGWLERLRQCAAAEPAAGIVAALSNVIGVVGHAGEGKQEPEPKPDPAPEFDSNRIVDAAERVGRGVAAAAVPLYPGVRITRACGVYVRREMLRRIGAFDERFADAGGALRDLGERVRNAGWRSVLCDDAFVYGVEDRSCAAGEIAPFATEPADAATAPIRAATEPADALKDATDAAAEHAGRSAEIAAICCAVRSQVARLAHSSIPAVLHVLHGRGGGTEKHVQELIAASRADVRPFLLRVLPDRWRLLDLDAIPHSTYDCARQRGSAARGWLGTLCAWLAVDAIHVHSLVGTDDDLVELVRETGLRYAYSVHDMYTACPTVYLIGSDGEHCNATTDARSCLRCLAGFDAHRDVDIVAWRERNRRFLEGAAAVFAPSAWAGETLRAYYPRVNVTLAPHAIAKPDGYRTRPVTNGWPMPVDDRAHVGVLGAIGPEKGARVVERMAERIRERRLPLRLVLVGYTDRDNGSQSQDGVLTVHGRYEAHEIAALFDHYRIALAVFPTVWPETFSYTLGETWLAGRPALVPPRGALQERVLASGAGWIMRGWPDVDAILDQLLALTAPANRDELARCAGLAERAAQRAVASSDPVREFYDEAHAAMIGKTRPAISRRRIHESACLALGLELAQPAAARTRQSAAGRSFAGSRLFRIFRG